VEQGKETVGFVGLGLMGRGMAANIRAKGHPLLVVAHRNRGPVEELVAAGAGECASARELASRSDILVLCVTGSPQVEAVCLGPDGILQGASERSGGRNRLVVVDCSTADPVSTARVATALAEAGIDFADAPMGGTPANTAAGTASCMVGADEAVFARVEPVLAAFANRVTHLGPVGSGHTMKLVNNFLSMGYAALYAEALTLARKSGISPGQFDSVIRGGRMDCGFYGTYMRWVLERDPDAHPFTLRNGLKDLTYVEALAQSAGMANPLGNAAKNSFATAVGTGRGNLFLPMLSDVVAELNGTTLAPRSEE
jgi:3-hydroxyisobutyrate dehydrogenase-like beta-hydroxyacid dehydrogenase